MKSGKIRWSWSAASAWSRPMRTAGSDAAEAPGARTGNWIERARRYGYALMMAIACVLLSAGPASAQVWSLSPLQRQSYLQYYAPLILQRSEENGGKPGRDWISNYDFDRDGNFANNRYTWVNLLPQYVAGSAAASGDYKQWRIRPTLYTSLVEYTDGGGKGLILLYHVYHPVDKKGNEIHDWERVEIGVRGVGGTPGALGESVGHVTVTSHHDHVMRAAGSPDLNFMSVASGKHVLLWQADEDGGLDPGGATAHELHFVQHSYAQIQSWAQTAGNAKVDVTNDGDKKVHYVWVPEASAAAVSAWGAQPIHYGNATSLASRQDGETPWYAVKRITYELQDIADVFRGQWDAATWPISWTADSTEDVLLETALLDEAGQVEVPAGLQRFYLGSRDSSASSQTDGRNGVLGKDWFMGAYSAETNADIVSGSDKFKGYEGAGRGGDGRNRADASGDLGSLNNYWRQHDFFVHSGAVDTRELYEAGTWLTGAWYTPANGGFDGRWAQLFDDRVAYEFALPLSVAITTAESACREYVMFTATAAGGSPPYQYSWSGTFVPVAGSTRSVRMYWQDTATVTVTSSDGQQVAKTHTYRRVCPGGGNP